MTLYISEQAASDCVQLGLNIDEIQRAVNRRHRFQKVRLSDGRKIKVRVNKQVILRVKPAFAIQDQAIDQANRIGIDMCKMMHILAQPRRPGGLHSLGDGICAVVRPIVGGEVVVAVVDTHHVHPARASIFDA
ncbi:MAG: hypothetical protein CL678_16750 [Bdellovibrionaceae bacterium]|nr:hypothetical protein [Pseudobdellovibrionaceae bacterium]